MLTTKTGAETTMVDQTEVAVVRLEEAMGEVARHEEVMVEMVVPKEVIKVDQQQEIIPIKTIL